MINTQKYIDNHFKRSRLERTSEIEDLLNYLYSPEAFLAMKVATDMGLPALCGVCKQIEALCENFSTFTLDQDTNKQYIGRFIKKIMMLYGYEKDKDEATVGNQFSTVFRTAATYKKTSGTPILEVHIDSYEVVNEK